MRFPKVIFLTHLGLILNLIAFSVGFLNLRYWWGVVFQNITGIVITTALLFNSFYMIIDNPATKKTQDMLTIFKYLNLAYLIYTIIAYIALIFYALNSKIGNFYIFMLVFLVACGYYALSLIITIKEIRLIKLPEKLPFLRQLITLVNIIVFVVCLVGVLNVIFRFYSVISLGALLVFSTSSWFFFLIGSGLWILMLKLRALNPNKKIYMVLGLIGFLLVPFFFLPTASMPWAISNANRQFQHHFGDEWNTFKPEISQFFIKQPFTIADLYYGHDGGHNYKIETGVCYYRDHNYSLNFDVYYPIAAGIGQNQTIIYVHGGGWVSGTRDMAPYSMRYLASQGYVVFSIDYRLTDTDLLDVSAEVGFDAPQIGNPSTEYLTGPYKIKDMVEDLGRFTYYLANSSNNIFGADLTSVILYGESAGAYLAALAAFGHSYPRFHPIFSPALVFTRVILFYPPNFATDFFYGHALYHNQFQMIDGTPESNPQDYFDYTPSNLINGSSIPCLILHGTIDNLVPIKNSNAILEKMNYHDRICIQIRIPFIGHGFIHNPQYQSFNLYYIERFLYLTATG